MQDISPTDAIFQARIELGVNADVPAEAVRTRRLDRGGGGYYLVVFGQNKAIAAATVDISDGGVMSLTRLPGTAPFPPISAKAALKQAHASKEAVAEAVWMPCRSSMSPLYIIWEIHEGSVTKYVDQQAHVMDRLSASRRGGGSQR